MLHSHAKFSNFREQPAYSRFDGTSETRGKLMKAGILGDFEGSASQPIQHQGRTGRSGSVDDDEDGDGDERLSVISDDPTSKSSYDAIPKAQVARLPPISEFGILDIRKPAEHEIRLGHVSNDCLTRIDKYSHILHSPHSGQNHHAYGQNQSNTNYHYQAPAMTLGYPNRSHPPSIQQQPRQHQNNHSYYMQPPQTYARSLSVGDQSLSLLANMAVSGESIAAKPMGNSISFQANGTSSGSGTSNYACSYPGCMKSFPSRSRLTRHEIVHQGLKNFQCIYPNCPKRFSRKDNMLQHYRNHPPMASKQEPHPPI